MRIEMRQTALTLMQQVAAKTAFFVKERAMMPGRQLSSSLAINAQAEGHIADIGVALATLKANLVKIRSSLAETVMSHTKLAVIPNEKSKLPPNDTTEQSIFVPGFDLGKRPNPINDSADERDHDIRQCMKKATKSIREEQSVLAQRFAIKLQSRGPR